MPRRKTTKKPEPSIEEAVSETAKAAAAVLESEATPQEPEAAQPNEELAPDVETPDETENIEEEILNETGSGPIDDIDYSDDDLEDDFDDDFENDFDDDLEDELEDDFEDDYTDDEVDPHISFKQRAISIKIRHALENLYDVAESDLYDAKQTEEIVQAIANLENTLQLK